MLELWTFILAMTCIVPAVAGLIVYKKMHKVFKPVVYILVLAVLTELLVRWSFSSKAPLISGYFITNIFLLVNTALHVWLFFELQIIKKKQIAILLLAAFVVALLSNIIYLGTISDFCFGAMLVSSILILLMAVEGITIQTFRSKQKWSSDFVFLFCIITVIYNANVVFYFSIALIGVKEGDLHDKVLNIYRFINAACNILYVWPILCIPRNNSYMKLF